MREYEEDMQNEERTKVCVWTSLSCNKSHGRLDKQAAQDLFVCVDSDNSETAIIRPQQEAAGRNVGDFLTFFSDLITLFPLSLSLVSSLLTVSARHPLHRHFCFFFTFMLSGSET